MVKLINVEQLALKLLLLKIIFTISNDMRNDFEMGKNKVYRAISRKGLKIFKINKIKGRIIELQKGLFGRK